MVTVVISHECKNYSDWRKVFDADEVNRSKAGFISTGVYHSVDNPNKITIIGEAPSVEAINGFMSNPELKATMEKGGVIGMPDVKILNKI
jgi:quinol monooxygenase YgiN